MIVPFFSDGGPDFSIVSKAWWDAIDLIQQSGNDKIFACDMALELRIMGGSDVTMAPQYGNKHGTLCIEPVSTRMVHKDVWEDFKDELGNIGEATTVKCRRIEGTSTFLELVQPFCPSFEY